MKRYDEEDWHSNYATDWAFYLKELMEMPIKALEIGSFEGRSACWIAENLLKHPESTLICIDPWDGRDSGLGERTIKAEKNFDFNVHEYGRKVIKYKRYSRDALSQFWLDRQWFHFIYVDGEHEGKAALYDLCQSWLILKPGGIMIFDDYHWLGNPEHMQPRDAFHAFHMIHPEMTCIHRGRQMFCWKDDVCGSL